MYGDKLLVKLDMEIGSNPNWGKPLGLRGVIMNKAILRKAGQVVLKVNKVVIKPVTSMMGFAHKTGRIHICTQCSAEYFNEQPLTCNHCEGKSFIMSSSLAKVDETLALHRAAHPVEVIDSTTGHVAHA